MFGLSKREKFKKRSYAFLSDVFAMRIETLLSHYPGIKKACDEDSKKKDGLGPEDSATFAARAVLVDRIAKLTPAQRGKIHIEYNQVDWNAFYVWFLNSRIERTSPPQQFDSLTLMIAHAQCAVHHALKVGDIDDMSSEDFRRDVAGSLEGLNADERLMERLRSSMDILIGNLGMDPEKFRPPT